MHPYWILGALVGVPVFFLSWFYCVAEYGFIIGVTIGWLPSGIVGGLAAAAWPLIGIGVLWAFAH